MVSGGGGRSGSQIASDIIYSVSNNWQHSLRWTIPAKIGITSGMYAFVERPILNAYALPAGSSRWSLWQSLRSTGGWGLPYAIAGYQTLPMLYAIFTDDPAAWARHRGITLTSNISYDMMWQHLEKLGVFDAICAN